MIIKEKDFELRTAQNVLQTMRYYKNTDTSYTFFAIIILSIRIEYLRTKGLLTGRGIFEYHLKQAGKELSNGPKGLDVATACEKIGSIFMSDKVPKAATKPNTYLICNILRQCNCQNEFDLKNLWRNNLCSDVHGFAWSGHSVQVYSVGLSEFEKCFLKSLVTNNGMSVEWTTDPLCPA